MIFKNPFPMDKNYEGVLDCYWRSNLKLSGNNCHHGHADFDGYNHPCKRKYDIHTTAGYLFNHKQWAHARRRDKIKRRALRRRGIVPPKAVKVD